MFRYLVCIRRLADLLRLERRGNIDQTQAITSQNRLLFQSDGSGWKPSRLTVILKNATRTVWGSELGARLYRQVAIGITEKYVREIHAPFNRYDDSSARADLNVAFAWQSGHRPLERGTTYGLDGAFPHRLQPALLRAYEWASTRWHQFIRQPSKVIATQHEPHASVPTRLDPATLKRVAPHDSARERPSVEGRHPAKQQKVLQVLDGSTLNSNHNQDITKRGSAYQQEARIRLDNLLCILAESRILVCALCSQARKGHREPLSRGTWPERRATEAGRVILRWLDL